MRTKSQICDTNIETSATSWWIQFQMKSIYQNQQFGILTRPKHKREVTSLKKSKVFETTEKLGKGDSSISTR